MYDCLYTTEFLAWRRWGGGGGGALQKDGNRVSRDSIFLNIVPQKI